MSLIYVGVQVNDCNMAVRSASVNDANVAVQESVKWVEPLFLANSVRPSISPEQDIRFRKLVLGQPLTWNCFALRPVIYYLCKTL